MKLKSTLIAAAVALVASTGANAALIDNGAGGNGGLFLNIWDANGSYSLNLGDTIDSFQNTLEPSLGSKTFTADATLTAYLASVTDKTALQWNVMATDTSGAKRVLMTYSALPGTTKTSDVVRTLASNVGQLANGIDVNLAAANSATFGTADAGYAGNTTYGSTFNNYLDFSNSAALGGTLDFLRIDAAGFGTPASTYTPFAGITLSMDQQGNLTMMAAAVPEPETYAMLLAGLGLMGFIARRRSNRA